MQVRGAPGKVQILADGQGVQEYPRGTKSRLLIDQSCYDPANVSNPKPTIRGAMEPTVQPPVPLGRIGRAIVAEKSWEGATRPLADYEALLRRSR